MPLTLRPRHLLGVAPFLLALSSAARAVTIDVPGDQPTIQAGLDAASPGDTVLVAPGTYTGSGNRTLDFAGKAVVLRSSGGAAATIFDGQHAATLFDFHSGETAAATVEGFTIRNGSDGTVYGGGALLTASSPTFRSCAFAQNAANQGGALYAEQSSMALVDCVFTGNSAANWGGAVYFLNSSPALSGCSFSGNTAGFGGGLYFSGGSATLTGCTFTGNAASTYGGAIYCRNGAATSLSGCSFSGNTGNFGAGIHAIESSLGVADCSFTGNLARNVGGGIYTSALSMVITDCTFTRNETTTHDNGPNGGAALFCRLDSASITRCEFSENSAVGANTLAGAVWLVTFAPSNLDGCTFSGNTASSGDAYQQAGGLDWSARGGSLSNCTFAGNVAGTNGGAARLSGMTVIGCRFSDNHSESRAGGVYAYNASFADCTFSGNTAITDGGALYYGASDSPPFTGCTFVGNSAARGGAMFLYGFAGLHPTVANCTFARNSSASGAGISTWNTTLTLDHSIIAESLAGEAVYCDSTSLAVVSCTDIFGNAGGDWVGCIADQYGINGCFAADPLFCAPSLGDFTLAETSPCAPAHSPAGCGLIGAHPVGCVAPIGVAEGSAPAAASGFRVVPIPLQSDGIIERTGAASGPAVLRLYDPAGRLVAATRAPAGAGRIRWNELSGGRRLPAGVYFLEVRGQVTRVPVVR